MDRREVRLRATTAAITPPDTARLGLRTWSDDDLPLARRLWGDAHVMRYLARAPLDEEAILARLEREHATLRDHGFQYWPMFRKDDGDFVGCCGLKICPYEGTADAPELELGFHLVPESWGQGFASEAGTAVARIAFHRLRVPRLWAGHHPENRASEAVLKKLGFTLARDVFFEATGLMHPLYVLEAR